MDGDKATYRNVKSGHQFSKRSSIVFQYSCLWRADMKSTDLTYSVLYNEHNSEKWSTGIQKHKGLLIQWYPSTGRWLQGTALSERCQSWMERHRDFREQREKYSQMACLMGRWQKRRAAQYCHRYKLLPYWESCTGHIIYSGGKGPQRKGIWRTAYPHIQDPQYNFTISVHIRTKRGSWSRWFPGFEDIQSSGGCNLHRLVC